LSYKRLIDHKKLPTEHMGKAPLDMAQYNKIFGTCRVPGTTSDSVIYNPNSRHIVLVTNRTVGRKFHRLSVTRLVD
jgi:carnitine O-acetyltransferase